MYEDGRTDSLTYEDNAFYGYIACRIKQRLVMELVLKERGLGQIRHIFATRGISAHQDISEYHIFWRLRHMYAVTPEPVTKVY